MLTDAVRNSHSSVVRMRNELQVLETEKAKVLEGAQEELDRHKKKHQEELALALQREQELLAMVVVQPKKPSSRRTATRGSPRRCKAPTTTPGRRRQVVRRAARPVDLAQCHLKFCL